MQKVIVICGATATGKTALAVRLAEHFDGEVISADSQLVYKGLTIGTAKPTEEEKHGIPHHMIDVCDATYNYTVSDYERAAMPILEDILSRGKTAIICGGTGFYIKSLLFKSTFGGTGADEKIRSELNAILCEKGNKYLHKLLEEVDPESAAILHENDVKRVMRAIEIFRITGKKKSEQNDEEIPRFPYVALAIDFDREKLYERCNLRVDIMIKEGLFEEIEQLLNSGVTESNQCMQAIGYKEVLEGMKNGLTQEEIAENIKKNTRNYAKRQITFFKKLKGIKFIEAGEGLFERAVREIEK